MSYCSVKLVTMLGRSSVGLTHKPTKLLPLAPGFLSIRHAHCQPITRNIRYISADSLDLKINKKTLRLQTPLERPLCIILSWLVSKQKHLMKYTDVYLEMGFDVITVTCSPLQLMFPVQGSQVVAANLMKFLESNEHRPLVVHGFSVGAYVWAELLVHALKDLERYQPVLDRVAAQVWDSPADVEELPIGLPISLFPNNKLMQKTLTAYVRTHMWVLYRIATQHYWRATHAFHEPPCRAPSLFLLSKVDPIGAATRSARARDSMTALGMKCNWQCWDDSPHVRHFYWHQEEYLAALYSHLQECGILRTDRMKQAERIRQ